MDVAEFDYAATERRAVDRLLNRRFHQDLSFEAHHYHEKCIVCGEEDRMAVMLMEVTDPNTLTFIHPACAPRGHHVAMTLNMDGSYTRREEDE